jgi:3-isopropylmalate/(R)-2-methylmalate dehydratase small subunit
MNGRNARPQPSSTPPSTSFFTGKVAFKFGDDINTDYIIPASLLQEAWNKSFFAEHAFERYDPSFVETCRLNSSNGNIVLVAGKNFGCGSSREQAVYAIQCNNIKAVIAESFPDIFYRNSINNGFPALAVETTRDLQIGDRLSINLENLSLRKEESDLELKISMTNGDRDSLLSGARLGAVKERLRKRLLATV